MVLPLAGESRHFAELGCERLFHRYQWSSRVAGIEEGRRIPARVRCFFASDEYKALPTEANGKVQAVNASMSALPTESVPQ
jgi:hypothetical protein